jgi:hypothetical protein
MTPNKPTATVHERALPTTSHQISNVRFGNLLVRKPIGRKPPRTIGQVSIHHDHPKAHRPMPKVEALYTDRGR